jgi:hypothetical protein
MFASACSRAQTEKQQQGKQRKRESLSSSLHATACAQLSAHFDNNYVLLVNE